MALEEALRRTKSGTRRAVRSDPSLPAPEEVDFLGPRDDTAPPLGHIDPSSLSPIPAAPPFVVPFPHAKPARTPESVALTTRAALSEAEPSSESEPLALVVPGEAADAPTPRLRAPTALLFGLAIAALVLLAALVGFVAGRNPLP